MSVRATLVYPHPFLRTTSEPVRDFANPLPLPDGSDTTLGELAEDLIDTMMDQHGLGLSAIQIGIPYRVVAIVERRPMVFVNPVLTLPPAPEVLLEEGCLSFPTIFLKVRRAPAVTVEAYGVDGRHVTIPLEGTPAQAMQHECEHMDGKLLIDHATPLKQKLINQRMRAYIKRARRTGTVLRRERGG